jgi:hypothetical protein
MLQTRNIRWSKSRASSPILLVPQAHGRGLRLCIDYRGINKITIVNRYPLLIMTKLEDHVYGSKIITKIDLKNSYQIIRIKEGDKWKTAFRCYYGLYKFLIMPFGLTNVPVSFQDIMNHILKDLLDENVVVYIVDILIYTNNTEQHDQLVGEVLQRFAKNDLVILPEKYIWAE